MLKYFILLVLIIYAASYAADEVSCTLSPKEKTEGILKINQFIEKVYMGDYAGAKELGDYYFRNYLKNEDLDFYKTVLFQNKKPTFVLVGCFKLPNADYVILGTFEAEKIKKYVHFFFDYDGLIDSVKGE